MVVHSTEVYSSLDINHSPFNVGFPIELPEFNSHKYMATASWNGTARLWRIESLDDSYLAPAPKTGFLAIVAA